MRFFIGYATNNVVPIENIQIYLFTKGLEFSIFVISKRLTMTKQQVFEILKNEYRIQFSTIPNVPDYGVAKSKDFEFITITNDCTMVYRYFYNDPIRGQQMSGWITVNIADVSEENLLKLIDNVDSNIWCS